MDGRTLWGEYALAQRRRGLAKATIETRRYLVRSWFQWNELEGTDVFIGLGSEHVERFLDLVQRTPAARCTATSGLHMFYVWAKSRGYTTVDPTEGVDRPRYQTNPPRPIHDTDLQLSLLFAEPDPLMSAALLLGSVSGLRCCEIGRLRWDDIEIRLGPPVRGQARVIGKGSKERVVPLNIESIAALDRIERTSEFVLDGWQSSWRPGDRASKMLTAHFRAAGAVGTAHRLRHRAATEALRKCHDLRKVQTLLGHASVATTAIYTKVDASDLNDILADATAPTVRPTARRMVFVRRPSSSPRSVVPNR